MNINLCCVLCRRKMVTTSHASWFCTFSKRIWLKFIPSLDNLFSMCRTNWNMIDIWEGLVNRLTGDDLSLAAIILWNLWNYRNKVAYNGLIADQHQIVQLDQF